jgi:DNA-binding MarR family transcriptional regulator
MSAKRKSAVSYLPLINSWEQFMQETGSEALEHFAVWLLERGRRSDAVAAVENIPQPYFSEKSEASGHAFHTAQAGYLIGRMTRFVRFYSKQMFQELGYSNSDEFGLLAAIDARGKRTKKSIILDQLQELTTGMDMLRRMVNQGWITETVNKSDKREKLLSITEAGRMQLFVTYRRLTEIPDVLADLPDDERQELVRLLDKLDRFHTRNYNAQLGLLSEN